MTTAGRLPRRLREPQLLPVGARPLLLHAEQLELVLEIPRPDLVLESFTLGIVQATLDIATTMPRGTVGVLMRGRAISLTVTADAMIRVLIPAAQRELEDVAILGLNDAAVEDEHALERELLGI